MIETRISIANPDANQAYQAPEAAQGLVSRAGDWWALGMIVAEAALGYHPFARPDGSLLPDQVIHTELAQRDVPHLDAIDDDRTRLLCRGLMTRDAQHRWGRAQVRAWLRGESPDVAGVGPGNPSAADPAGLGVGIAGPRRTVLFQGVDYGSPQDLAAAFAVDPAAAGSLLFERKDPLVLEDLRLLLRGHGLPEAQALLDSYRSGPWEPMLLRLLVEMDPRLAPILEGQSMTPQAMARLAAEVLEAGHARPDQQRLLAWVTDFDVWRLWRGLPGMGDATRAERDRPDATHAERGAAAAWAVLLGADPQAGRSALQRVLEQHRESLRRDFGWLRRANSGDLAEQIEAAVAIPETTVAMRDRDAAWALVVRNQVVGAAERRREAAARDYQSAVSELLGRVGSAKGRFRRRRDAPDLTGCLAQLRLARASAERAGLVFDRPLADNASFAGMPDKQAYVKRALAEYPQLGPTSPEPRPDTARPAEPRHVSVLASGGDDREVRVWDPVGGQLLHTLTGHTDGVQAVAFGSLPDGRTVLASGGVDREVRLWDPVGGQLLHTLTGHTGWVQAVAFGSLPDGRTVLASGGVDREVRLWDPVGGQLLHTLTGHTDWVGAMAFGYLPDGRTVLASGADDRTVRLWDPVAGQPLHTLTGHTDRVGAVALGSQPDRRTVLASGSGDRTVRLWDAASGALLRTFNHAGPHGSVALGALHDGGPLIASGVDWEVRVWDPVGGQPLHTLTGHTDSVRSVAFGALPHGRTVIASAGDDGEVRLWDPAGGQPLHTLTGHTGWVRSVAFGVLPLSAVMD